jgi:predicted HTH transcriptional regulator
VDVRKFLEDKENASIERKQTARVNVRTDQPDPDMENAVIRTVAGFLNADGGVLILGQHDDGTVVGIQRDLDSLRGRPDEDGYEQYLVTLLIGAVGKPRTKRAKIEFVDYNGVTVCLVRVQPYHKETWAKLRGEGEREKKFFVRIGNTTQRLVDDEITTYVRDHF